jgi:hypothetical protein
MKVIADCEFLALYCHTELILDSFVFTFIALHIMVFTFGMMNYGFKVQQSSTLRVLRTDANDL